MIRPVRPTCFPRASGSCSPSPAAAAAEPKILLLDEITANLDAETEQTVLSALRRAADGRTVLSISHRATARTGRECVIS